jgi:hypothetical protein
MWKNKITNQFNYSVYSKFLCKIWAERSVTIKMDDSFIRFCDNKDYGADPDNFRL